MGSLRQQALNRMLAEHLVLHGGKALILCPRGSQTIEVRATDGPRLDVVIEDYEFKRTASRDYDCILFEEMDPR